MGLRTDRVRARNGEMPMSDDASRAYLERRLQDCLDKAERSTDPSIARVHREFARKYAEALGVDQPPVTHFTTGGS